MLKEIQQNIQGFRVGYMERLEKVIQVVLGLSIQNTLEAKVKPKDSTETELRKINIIKNLNISTSYNLQLMNLSYLQLGLLEVLI